MTSHASERVALPRLGFGGSQLGNLSRPTLEDDARDAVDAAWEGGIRYFDTAPHYGLGLSERRLGDALRSRPRDEYRLSTKVGRLLVDSPETADRLDGEGFAVPAERRRVWDFSRAGILRSIEASLARLRTDRVDVAYLHDPDQHWDAASTTGVDALVELRDQGVVGAIGAGMNQTAMLTEFVRRCDVDVVMVAGRLTLLDQDAERELLPLATERGVAVVAAGVYNSGVLSRAEIPEQASYDYADAPLAVVDRARRIAERAAVFGVTVPEAAVAFPLRHDAVQSVVVGVRSRAQVDETLRRVAADIPDGLWDDLVAHRLIAPHEKKRAPL